MPPVCKPGSVRQVSRPAETVISLDTQSPACSSSLPATSLPEWTLFAAYLALLPLGFASHACCHACGELLPRRFTLTRSFLQAVCFLLHFPSLGILPPRAQALPGSVSKEPGLSSISTITVLIATVQPVTPSQT